MLAKGTALGYFLQTLCVFIEPADSWRGSDLCMAFPTTLLLLLDSIHRKEEEEQIIAFFFIALYVRHITLIDMISIWLDYINKQLIMCC